MIDPLTYARQCIEGTRARLKYAEEFTPVAMKRRRSYRDQINFHRTRLHASLRLLEACSPDEKEWQASKIEARKMEDEGIWS